MIHKTFLFLSIILLLQSCKQKDLNTTVNQDQPEYPVLKLSEYNNVLGIKISLADTALATILEEVVINTQGTTRTEDIESVSLYYTGDKASLINEKSMLFSTSREVSQEIHLKGSMKLNGRNNFFQVSYKLKKDADILDRIGCYCVMVNTDRGNADVTKLNDPKNLRIGVAVRKHGDDNVNTYRIPGLVTTNSGSLLAVYDVRRDSKRDLQGNIDIGVSRSIDGGNTWEPMVIALDMDEWGGLPEKFNGVSDASLLVDKNSNNIFVAGLWMHGVLDENGKWIANLTQESDAWNHQWRNRGSQPGYDVKQSSQFLMAVSNDDGKTWGEPVNLTGMCKKKEWWLWAPAPGRGITMDDGTLVLPTQGRDKRGLPFSNITYSRDGGKTWKTSAAADTNTTECSVVQLDDGSLMLNMRDNRNKNNEGADNGRAVAVTRDMGQTWTVHPSSHKSLPEPVCMASLYKQIYKHDGKTESIIFFSNPATKKGRNHITIKASFDNGNTWPERSFILLDEGTGNGYSCLTGVNNDYIGILYESSQANLVFQKIPVQDFLK